PPPPRPPPPAPPGRGDGGEPVGVVAPHALAPAEDADVVDRTLDGPPLDVRMPVRGHRLQPARCQRAPRGADNVDRPGRAGPGVRDVLLRHAPILNSVA